MYHQKLTNFPRKGFGVKTLGPFLMSRCLLKDELSTPAVRDQLVSIQQGRDRQQAQLNALGIGTVFLGCTL